MIPFIDHWVVVMMLIIVYGPIFSLYSSNFSKRLFTITVSVHIRASTVSGCALGHGVVFWTFPKWILCSGHCHVSCALG